MRRAEPPLQAKLRGRQASPGMTFQQHALCIEHVTVVGGTLQRRSGRRRHVALRVTLVAARYGFYPNHIEIPADTPVTFRMASVDVLHAAHIPMTNMSTMVVPGYVSQVTTTFPKPGDYPLLCNEYCGLGHDHMWSKVTVIAKEDWHGVAAAEQQGNAP